MRKGLIFALRLLTLIMLSCSTASAESGIDYSVLVNRINPLPDGWEDALSIVRITNSVGDVVEVEKKTYEAYLRLKEDLLVNDGIYLELDSGYRSVAAQQDIMDRFIRKYGADYAAKTVAVPGYSEHHTGLAVDLYFKVRNEDGTFRNVYSNEDMTKPEYEGIWDRIHGKLGKYGFILRYLRGKEHITGYGYEPWHIRYLDDAGKAKEIMAQPGMTLEVWLGKVNDPNLTLDYGTSEIYTREELEEAAIQFKCWFAGMADFELHALRYAGDDCSSGESMMGTEQKQDDVQTVVFLIDFHSPADPGEDSPWEADREYTNCAWRMMRTTNSGWQVTDRIQ